MNDKKLLSVMVMDLLFNKEYCRKSCNFWECVTAINEECGSGRKYDSIENGLHGDILNDYVSWHSPEQLDVFKPMPSHTLKTLVKIQSPWKVVIPKDYYLLITSVPYNDEDVFTVAPGLLQGENFLNVQMFWHKLNKKHIIKEGTPLCYYLLIEKKKYEFNISCIK